MGYDGFISYSHAADGRLAPALQAGLERLAKPWNHRRALRVFRDETGLSTNPHLWSAIEMALDESDWFLLLASPKSAESEWVNKELGHWLATKSPDRILPVVTDGVWGWDPATGGFTEGSTAVPKALRAVFGDEPRHLDLRWAQTELDLDLRNARFRGAVADLAAPLHGIPKDELEGEDIRQHRRTRRLARGAVAGLVVLLLAAIIAGVAAIGARDQAQHETYLAKLQRAAAQAVAGVEADPARSMLVAAEVQARWDRPETRTALLTTMLRAGPLVSVRRHRFGSARVASLSGDASLTALVDARGVVRLSVPESGASVRSIDTRGRSEITSIRLSNDGALVAIGDRRGVVEVRRTADGTRACPAFRLARHQVRTVAFAEEGRVLLVGLIDGVVMSWQSLDVTRCAMGSGFVSDQGGSAGADQAVVVSPDGARVAFPGVPIEIRDARLSALSLRVAPSGAIKSVAFSPDGTRLVVADTTKLFVLDSVSGIQLRPPIPLSRSKPEQVTIAPSGTFAAVRLSDGTTEIVDLNTGATRDNPLVGPTTTPFAEAFTADGQGLVAVSAHEAVVWELQRIAPIGAPLAFDQRTYDVAFGPESEVVYAAAQDGAAHRLGRASGMDRGTLAAHTPGVPNLALGMTSVALGSHGNWLVTTADTDPVLLLTSTRTGKELRAPLRVASDTSEPGNGRNSGSAYSAAVDPAGAALAVTNSSGEVVAVDVAKWRVRWRVRTGASFERELPAVFSHDGTRVFSTDAVGIVALSARTGQLVSHGTRDGQVIGLAVDPTTGDVAAAFSDGAIEVLDPRTLRIKERLTSPDGTIQGVGFVPRSRVLVAVGAAGTVQLWDLSTRKLLGRPLPSPTGETGEVGAANLAVSPDGRYVAVAYHPGGVVVWSLDPRAWRRRVCDIAGRTLTRREWSDAFGAQEFRPTCRA